MRKAQAKKDKRNYIEELRKMSKEEGWINRPLILDVVFSANSNALAKEIVLMHEAYKNGNFIDITNTVL